ncbi:MAG TPA: hypothetical protein VEI53_11130, partial [Ktedonobacteraceae bacterium]|nr:hypothetical protein [Ktedonobacteraceae bacterium]
GLGMRQISFAAHNDDNLRWHGICSPRTVRVEKHNRRDFPETVEGRSIGDVHDKSAPTEIWSLSL